MAQTDNTIDDLKKINPLLLPLPWLLVIVFVIIFVAMKYSNSEPELASAQKKQKVFPQIFMTDVIVHEFSNEGKLRFQLKTPSIRHFQMSETAGPQDYTLFDSPDIEFSGEDQEPAWHLSAKQGRNDTNGDLITLSTDVLAQQASKTQGNLSIRTDELHLNTREQFAETDKAVIMHSEKTHLETIGIRANLKQDQIELLSNVTGTYEP